MDIILNNQTIFNEDLVNAMHLYWGGWLDIVMISITSLGKMLFYITIFPLFYWCYDRSVSLKIAVIFLVSVTVNHALKDFWSTARPDPDLLSPGIRELTLKYMPGGPGFPSGHTQGPVSLWVSAIFFIRKRWVIITGVILMLLIPYSRIYLGVHYVGDIIGGYIFAILCCAVTIPIVLASEKWLRSIHRFIVITAIIALPFIAFNIISGYKIDYIMGILSGILAGAYLAEGRIIFHPRNRLPATLIKLGIGFPGIVIISLVAHLGFPRLPAYNYFFAWLIGFWCTFTAPLIFSKIPMARGEVL